MVTSKPSLELPTDIASGYRSAAQRARVLTEAWAHAYLRCPCCGGALAALAANTRVRDFVCVTCGEAYQLKSGRGRLKVRLTGAAYEPTRDAFVRGEHPSLLLLGYSADGRVIDVEVIYRGALTESCLIPRKPLGPNARRAGWKGCVIALDQLPALARISVVREGEWADPDEVRRRWAVAERVLSGSGESRGWTADVLRVVERLPVRFTLADVYAHESTLAVLHPDNRNVRPKIRQQLQVLRDRGLLQFLAAGQYVRTDARTAA